ncbi:MAG: hypothetical protein ACXVEE_20260 [Polyangiales bacterium]
MESEGHVARIEAPRAEQVFPPEGADADPCEFSIVQIEVAAADYALNGLRVPDLDTLGAKLQGEPCPTSRVMVLADGELSSARVIRAFERILSRRRKVAIAVPATAPLPGGR